MCMCHSHTNLLMQLIFVRCLTRVCVSVYIYMFQYRCLDGTMCDERIIRVALDPAFTEGRQFGRGQTGGNSHVRTKKNCRCSNIKSHTHTELYVCLYYTSIYIYIDVCCVLGQVRDEMRENYDVQRDANNSAGFTNSAERPQIKPGKHTHTHTYPLTRPVKAICVSMFMVLNICVCR